MFVEALQLYLAFLYALPISSQFGCIKLNITSLHMLFARLCGS